MRQVVQLVVLLALAGSAACASSGAVPRPFPAPAGPSARREPGSAYDSPSAGSIVSEALALRGAPYRNGGSDRRGFDCSGLVWYVFAQQGIAVPRTVAAQFHVGRSVRQDQLRPGDLVFFDTGQAPASHVGVAVGGDAFVHAPSSRGSVRVEHLGATYWSSRFVGARRVE